MPAFGDEKSTARRSALLGDLPSPMRRVLVAGSAAALVAAVALTVAFWPAKEPHAAADAAPTIADGARRAARRRRRAGASGARPTFATLQIHVDAPANIAVDGQAQPLGDSATVNVQPGVEHVVTVQRPGHSLRKLHVPALAAGEHMPLTFSVR